MVQPNFNQNRKHHKQNVFVLLLVVNKCFACPPHPQKHSITTIWKGN